MTTICMFVRPERLIISEKYHLRLSLAYDSFPKYVEVTFVDYDTCPAYVFIQNAEEDVMRCNRADLFQILVVGDTGHSGSKNTD